MTSATQTMATLADLSRVSGKAELIAGRIVHLRSTGCLPNRVAGRVDRSLAERAVPGRRLAVDALFAS